MEYRINCSTLTKRKSLNLTKDMSKENTQAQPLTEAELKKREDVLSASEEKLKADQETLKKDQDQLKADKEKLVMDQKDLEKREKALAKSQKEVKPEKEVPGVEFEFQGLTKKFTDAAPKSIRYDGKVWSQTELIEDEDALMDLVSSNSHLFENVNS